jgi:hypothetical protein
MQSIRRQIFLDGATDRDEIVDYTMPIELTLKQFPAVQFPGVITK